MAYVFDRLSKLMNDQNANIFQQNGVQQNTPQRSPGFSLTGGGGDATGGGAQVQDTGGQRSQASSTSGASQQEIVSKNQPTVGASNNILSGVSSALQGQTQKLQDEANSYGSKVTAQKSDLVGQNPNSAYNAGGDDKVAKAFESGDYETLKKGLAGEKSDIGAFTTSVMPENINIPKSRDELASYLQTKSGPQYSKGMSRLDASLLGKSSDFQSQQQDLQTRKEALQAQRNKAMGLTGDKQNELASMKQSEADYIRQALGSYGEGMVNKQRSGAGKQAFDASLKRGPDEAAKKAAMEAAIASTGSGDIALQELYATIDPSKFYSNTAQGGDVNNYVNYMDEPEFAKYSKLQELLGQTTAKEKLGSTGSFDTKGLEQAIKTHAEKYREKQKQLNPARVAVASNTVKENANKPPIKKGEEKVPESIERSKTEAKTFEKIPKKLVSGFKKNMKSLSGRLVM